MTVAAELRIFILSMNYVECACMVTCHASTTGIILLHLTTCALASLIMVLNLSCTDFIEPADPS